MNSDHISGSMYVLVSVTPVMNVQVEHFVDIHMLSTTQAASRIADDNIQVLITLDGWTEGSRNDVLALQPAPVQLQVQGFSSTMAAPFMQYLLADHVSTPPDMRYAFGEHLILMPGTYFGSSYRQLFPPPSVQGNRLAAGLPQDKFVYCSFNQLYKITPHMYDIWMKILQHVPNSVLWLLEYPAVGVGNLRKEAEKRGVDPTRLIFTPLAPPEQHIDMKAACDVFLDTHPYGAHGTAMDALYAGVPIVTLTTRTMAGRVAASVLNAAGLANLICTTKNCFEEQAIHLAQDRLALVKARAQLVRARNMPGGPFDTATYVKHLQHGVEIAHTLRENNLVHHIILSSI